jgi:hypothetical protein
LAFVTACSGDETFHCDNDSTNTFGSRISFILEG